MSVLRVVLRLSLALTVLLVMALTAFSHQEGARNSGREGVRAPEAETISGSTALSDSIAQAIATSDVFPRIVETAYSGVPAQAAVFTRPPHLQGFPHSGSSFIVLSTGRALDTPGQATDYVSTDMGGVFVPGGSPDGYNAYDVATLTVTLDLAGMPSGVHLSFVFKFGSEEILTYVGSGFQDFFTAYILDSDGNRLQNIALLPDGKPVTVDNAVQYANRVKGSSANPLPPFPVPDDVAFNAVTSLLTASVDLTPYVGQQISIEFQIGDASDEILDSAVFIDTLSFSEMTDVGIERTQLIQAIQKAEHPTDPDFVPLIAGKPTVMRVYVDTQSAVSGVTGVLRIYEHGQIGLQAPIRTASPDPVEIRARVSPLEQRVRDTLNFYFTVPSGTYDFEVEIWHPANSIRFRREYIGYTFNDTQRVRLVWVSIIRDLQFPSWARISSAHEWMQKTYPVASVDYRFIDLGLQLFGNIDVDPARRRALRSLSRRLRLHNLLNNPDAHAIVGWLPEATRTGTWRGVIIPSLSATMIYDLPDYYPRTLAHEIGHDFGLNLQPYPAALLRPGWCRDNNSSEEYCLIDQPRVGEGGFDVSSRAFIPATHYNFMNNKPTSESWVTRSAYMHLYGELSALGALDALVMQSSGEFIIVSGAVDQDGTVTLDEFYVLTGETTPTTFPGGPYELQFVSATDDVLASYAFTPDFTLLGAEEISSIAPFVFVVPYPAGTRFIRVVRSTQPSAIWTSTMQLAAQVEVSPNAPTVTVTYPTGGETLEGTVFVTWDAEDADGDTLIYSVMYSPDGADWLILAEGLEEETFEMNTESVPGGTNCRVRVLATDGVNTASDVSNPFTVTSKPPLVTIVAPDDDSTFEMGISWSKTPSLVFLGSGHDLEDGRLPADMLVWSSNIDGFLGTGEEVRWSYLTPGTHTITLEGTDSDGNVAADSIVLHVTEVDPTPPAPPAGLSAVPLESALALSWDANEEADLAGYKIHYGNVQAGEYQSTVDVGLVTDYQLTGLTGGTVYYVALTAYDEANNESDFSGEVQATPTVSDETTFRVTREGDVHTVGTFHGDDFVTISGDLAEWVSVSEPVEPGHVLEIDPTGIGQYRLAQGPCTVSVAGVVSTQPGMVLGHTGDTEGQSLLALLGVVPVKVTDEGGPIATGDLLIVSSIPGYAMRWEPDSGICGLVGKALEPHEEGEGMIEVLLTR